MPWLNWRPPVEPPDLPQLPHDKRCPIWSEDPDEPVCLYCGDPLEVHDDRAINGPHSAPNEEPSTHQEWQWIDLSVV